MTSTAAPFSARTVIVTGAGRGIGSEIARRFVNDGSVVYALDVGFESSPDGCRTITCDITRDEDVRSAVARVTAETGRIDVLVNNAGINVAGNLADADLATVSRGFDVNVLGLLRMSQAVLPMMKAAGGGRIINAASFAALIPAFGGGAYAATKSAVVQLSRALAGEVGPWNITVNSYAPGMIPSTMNGFSDLSDDEQSALLDTLTLRRWGRAEEIADLVAFLASDQASYITGALFDVSGGKLVTQMPQRAYAAASCTTE